MTHPITESELEEWDHVYGSVKKALDNDEPWDDAYFERIEALDAVVECALPCLLAEHGKMRAHLVDTIGEAGLKEVLGDN